VRTSKEAGSHCATGNAMAEFKSLDLRKGSAKPVDTATPEPADTETVKAESAQNESDRPRPTGPQSRRRRLPQKSPSRSDPKQQDGPDIRKPSRPPQPRRRPPARSSAPPSPPPPQLPPPPPPPQPRPPAVTTPIIGVVGSFRRFNKLDDHTSEYHYVYHPYINAIHQAGGVPVIIPVGLEGRFPNHVIDIINGLLLIGGGDIDPNLYGDLLTSKLMFVEPKKDRTEIDIFNLAFNKNIPVLGICRGIQLMNVALDGTLYQDILSQVRMAIAHKPEIPSGEPSHTVRIEQDSKLYKALGESEIWVNSSHHQAIKLFGKGLICTAKATDGIVEAVEHPNKKWVIGVQWHPELLFENDKIQAKLFKAFVDACKS